MQTQKIIKITKKWTTPFFALTLGLLGVTASATKNWVQDRRVTMAEAKRLAENSRSSIEFPVVVNDRVLHQLNIYLGTPQGRSTMKSALQRMKIYEEKIASKISQYGLPSEILAIPLIESGYRNLPEAQNSGWPTWRAAGIWQFIQRTAIDYGLIVEADRDDRLNVDLLTDAAMRYLQSNHLRFQDWHLAVLAYNMGERAVQKGIDKTGQRNAWHLIDRGYEGDRNYLAKVIAAVIILKNKDLLLS